MQRDPSEKYKADFYKRIKYSTFYPIFFWYKCDKCGKEFTREKMYEFNGPSVIEGDLVLPSFFDMRVYGCTHCFCDLENFKDYCKRYICFDGKIEGKTPCKTIHPGAINFPKREYISKLFDKGD